MKTLLLMTLIAISTVACSRQQASDVLPVHGKNAAIIGGEAVSSEGYARKATVGIYYRGKVSCTGVLISKNLVVTAAHCVKWVNDVSVGFGEALLEEDKLKSVQHIIIHPDFKIVQVPIPWNPSEMHPTSQKDIALLKLSEDAPEEFTPVGIYQDTDKIPLDSKLLLAGFGVTDDSEHTAAKSLNEVTVSLFALADDYLVIDQRDKKGACFGDSGGPAYISEAGTWYVAGITHGTRPGYTNCIQEADYTSLSKHTEFIVKTAEMLQAEAPIFAFPVPEVIPTPEPQIPLAAQ
ncbi:S1 family peptidase [Bdellovibrio sp. HCB274]|uniref:S1 family peptidase n=1 Tax=Bdellovibrio sp. HCB274 TaxID=3394361 RepID=UPI0039B403C4